MNSFLDTNICIYFLKGKNPKNNRNIVLDFLDPFEIIGFHDISLLYRCLKFMENFF
ncbi:toxin-antitoxin system, toxin component, PIN domain protein [Leptospira meyeri serovar Semaranga str. Veldrot Semarang 173]|nr:toxin-antitoxin system, toxin component, PIN domain protein [Leptospira meyeri serovar Semaranga str. Veldrot Semarang 173]